MSRYRTDIRLNFLVFAVVAALLPPLLWHLSSGSYPWQMLVFGYIFAAGITALLSITALLFAWIERGRR